MRVQLQGLVAVSERCVEFEVAERARPATIIERGCRVCSRLMRREPSAELRHRGRVEFPSQCMLAKIQTRRIGLCKDTVHGLEIPPLCIGVGATRTHTEAGDQRFGIQGIHLQGVIEIGQSQIPLPLTEVSLRSTVPMIGHAGFKFACSRQVFDRAGEIMACHPGLGAQAETVGARWRRAFFGPFLPARGRHAWRPQSLGPLQCRLRTPGRRYT